MSLREFNSPNPPYDDPDKVFDHGICACGTKAVATMRTNGGVPKPLCYDCWDKELDS